MHEMRKNRHPHTQTKTTNTHPNKPNPHKNHQNITHPTEFCPRAQAVHPNARFEPVKLEEKVRIKSSISLHGARDSTTQQRAHTATHSTLK